MNSAITFLPCEATPTELEATIRSATEWASWAPGAAAAETGRIYWRPTPEIRGQYEPDEWTYLAELGADPETCWIIDYSMGITTIRKVLSAIATRWPNSVIDLDVGVPLSGSAYLSRVAKEPGWDWWAPEN